MFAASLPGSLQSPQRPTLCGTGAIAAVLATLLLHLAVAALLVGWQPPAPPAAPAALSVETRLIVLPKAQPQPIAAPQPVAEPPPVTEPTPPADPSPPQPTLAEAALAQRRVAEQAALARAEQEHEMQEALRREAERQETERRQAEALQAQQERERIEAQRLAEAQQLAEEHPAAAAAASRRYEPLQKTAPDYPTRALERRIEGDCTVRYTVSERGRVVDPAVEGDCHPLFVMPSLAAAKRFRYKPRIVDGRAVAVAGVTNTFHYRIEAQD